MGEETHMKATWAPNRSCRQLRTHRYLEEIRNPGLSPVVVSVTISGKLGLDNNTRIVGGAFGLAA